MFNDEMRLPAPHSITRCVNACVRVDQLNVAGSRCIREKEGCLFTGTQFWPLAFRTHFHQIYFLSVIMLFLTPGSGSWSIGCNFGVIFSYNCFTSSTIGNLEAPEPGHQPEEEEAQEQQMHAAPPPSLHSPQQPRASSSSSSKQTPEQKPQHGDQ